MMRGVLIGCFGIFSVISTIAASAQTIPDGTLGSERSIIERNNQVELIRGGAQRGQNLFHSFQEFNVGEGQSTYFLNPSSTIQNILTRVTGGDPSEILGTIGIRNASGVTSQPNLFLINPQGILFGENARLEIGGSFIATTANGVRFEDQGNFSATNPESPTLLTINPSALLFMQLNSGEIVNRAGGSSSLPSASSALSGGLFLVGGDIKFEGGTAGTLGNRAELAAISGVGQVGLTDGGRDLKLVVPGDLSRGDITLQDQSALTAVRGDITIYARNLNIANQSVIGTILNTNDSSQSSRAGDITLNVSDKFVLQQGSTISSIVGDSGVGSGGNITINAGTIEISRASSIVSLHRGQGDGGSIEINARDRVSLDGLQTSPSDSVALIATLGLAGQGASGGINLTTGSLSILNGGIISSISDRVGDSGSIALNARGNITVSGIALTRFVTSGVRTTISNNGIGKSGDIQITAETLDIKQGGSIATSIAGRGSAGNIKIVVRDRIALDEAVRRGTNPLISSIFSNALPREGSEGNSGNIDISTGTLTVTNGAIISTDTGRNGSAGDITINARDQVIFDGSAPTEASEDIDFSSGATTSVFSNVNGNGGNIAISTGVLTLSNGGSLISNMFGQGNGGNILINARDRILISGRTPSISRSSISTNLSGTGQAGDITLTTGVLRIEGSGTVEAVATGRGNAGKIFVNASDSVVIDGAVKVSGNFQSVVDDFQFPKFISSDLTEILDSSKISSSAGLGTTNGGEIQISTGKLVITNGGSIEGFSLSGNSAKITVNSREIVTLDGVSKDFILFDGSEIRNRSGINNEVSNGGTGNVGTVAIQARELSILNGAQISSDTRGGGKGGDIMLNVRDRVIVDGGQFGRESNISSSSSDTTLPDGTFRRGRGDAGSIAINTGILTVRNNAVIISSSTSIGKAGSIDIAASQVQVKDQAGIGTVATTVDGGNININASNFLLLRNGSVISTTAGNGNPQATGTGGNIDIDAGFLIAVPQENSDISANATRGNGGRVNIDAQGIFGTQFRLSSSSESDITASSEFGTSGTVTLNTPDTDPSRGLAELPSTPTDPSNQIDQRCTPRARSTSSFIYSGRGGIPANPTDPLNEENRPADWITLEPEDDRPSKPNAAIAERSTSSIVEAKGWRRDINGDIHLVAEASPNLLNPSQSAVPCPD